MSIHKYAFLDQDFCKMEDAKISVMTHAFLYGTAVFEGIRAYHNPDNGKLYLLHARPHLERLLNSCKILRMNPYFTVDEMLDITIKLLKKNAPSSDTYIRPSWFKATERIGPNLVGPTDDEDKFVVTTLSLGEYLDLDKGLSVQVSNWRRLSDNAIPARAKVNGSYVNTALSKSTAHLAGFDDAIFLTEEGHVSEGSAMNLFLVRNGKLVTSGVTENILEGITRNFVMEIAKEEMGIETEVRCIDRTELYLADEAFFVGTGAQIAPIGKIDNYDIGNTKAGPVCKKLQELYKDICLGKNIKFKDAIQEI